jgi:hypothetical protein
MLALSLLPPVAFLGRPELFDSVLAENRVRAALPPVPGTFPDYTGFPAAFDRFMFDNFGLRNLLIEANARIKYGLLNSAASRKVLVGSDGWLFLNSRRNIRDYAGLAGTTVDDLRRWRIVLEERRDWLQEHGAEFGVAVAPAKQSVYEKYMPEHLGPRSENSALDRFVAYMAETSDVAVLDLRIPLREAETRHQVYFRTDSHWNFDGALAAYRYVAGAFPRVFGGQRILDYPDLVATQVRYRTNLPAMMGLKGAERINGLERRDGWRARSSRADDREGGLRRRTGITRTSEIDDPSLKRGLFMVDSFYGWSSQFFAEHFQRLVAVNRFNFGWKLKDAFPVELIAAERPDFVLMQIVEGHLWSCNKPGCLASARIDANPPEVRQARLRRLFAAAAQAPVPLQVAGVIRSRTPMARVRGAAPTEPAWRVVLASQDAGPLGPGPFLLRLGVAADDDVLIRSAFSGQSACLKRQEVTELQVGAGTTEVFLCVDDLDGGGGSDLRLLGNGDKVRFSTAAAVKHPDI